MVRGVPAGTVGTRAWITGQMSTHKPSAPRGVDSGFAQAEAPEAQGCARRAVRLRLWRGGRRSSARQRIVARHRTPHCRASQQIPPSLLRARRAKHSWHEGRRNRAVTAGMPWKKQSGSSYFSASLPEAWGLALVGLWRGVFICRLGGGLPRNRIGPGLHGYPGRWGQSWKHSIMSEIGPGDFGAWGLYHRSNGAYRRKLSTASFCKTRCKRGPPRCKRSVPKRVRGALRVAARSLQGRGPQWLAASLPQLQGVKETSTLRGQRGTRNGHVLRSGTDGESTSQSGPSLGEQRSGRR